MKIEAIDLESMSNRELDFIELRKFQVKLGSVMKMGSMRLVNQRSQVAARSQRRLEFSALLHLPELSLLELNIEATLTKFKPTLQDEFYLTT